MIVSFDDYCLDTERLLLSKDERPIDVEPQVFSVLQVLIENRHKVVTKEDLINAVWRGRVMSDAAISSRIKSARKAIGDDGRTQRLIKTIHGIGFRFVADVEVAKSRVQAQSSTANAVATDAAVQDDRPSIVVLPFKAPPDISPPILPQGLAHDAITGLSRLRWLKVIARSSAFRAAEADANLQEINRLTQVRYCLSGFLSSEGKKLTLSYELTDMREGTVLYADRIVAGTGHLNEIRSEITKQLIATLETHISDREAFRARLRSTENLDAWESYHLATMHLYRFTAEDNQRAVQLFTRATTLAPDFARAHAGLSAAEFQNAFNAYPGVSRENSIASSVNSAELSIALDKLDPLANFVMGRTHWLKGETDKSIAWLERALSLNPNYAHGYYAHGLASIMTSSDLRSYGDSEQAISLSPLDPFLYGFYGIRAFSFLADEDIERARTWAEKAALQPEAIVVMDLLAAAICEMAGDETAAARWIARARERHPGINGDYFFRALPFSRGTIRSHLESAFNRLRI